MSINIIKLNVLSIISTTNTPIIYEFFRKLMVITVIQIKQILDIGILVILSFTIVISFTTFIFLNNTKINIYIAKLQLLSLSFIGLTIIFNEHLVYMVMAAPEASICI
eukprot:225303_1